MHKETREEREKKFWEKVYKTDHCWYWMGSLSSGYGRFFFEPTGYLAHRASWYFAYGPIPDGLFVCHHCDNPRCVNPNHLFLGTNLDNIRDMLEKGRGTKGKKIIRAKNEYCIRGHKFTPENTVNLKNGKRRCRACTSMFSRKYYSRNKEQTGYGKRNRDPNYKKVEQ